MFTWVQLSDAGLMFTWWVEAGAEEETQIHGINTELM